MKVKVIKAGLSSYWYADKIGREYDVEEIQSNNKFEYKVVGSELVGTKYFDKDDVEIINEEKVMKKSDLRTGMRVVTADGWFGICMNLEGKNVIVSGKDYLFIDGMKDDLTCENASGCNVMEVYGLPTSYLHMLNPEVKGDLLWKREEKTPEQVELDKLMSQIQALQAQAEKLQQVVNK